MLATATKGGALKPPGPNPGCEIFLFCIFYSCGFGCIQKINFLGTHEVGEKKYIDIKIFTRTF